MVTFARDMIISEAIHLTIKKTIDWIRDRKKSISGMSFELEFEKQNGEIKIIRFYATAENYEALFEEANKILTSELIEKFEDDKIISVWYDENQLQIDEF